MKRLVFVVTVVLLAIAILSGGCSTKTTPAPAPAAKPPATGVLTDVNTPAEGGQDVVTITTPQGPTSVQVTPQTGFAFNGQFCTLDDLEAKIAAAEAANVSYNCTIVYDDMLGALAVYVTGP
ncbi:MAG: hypothetical protein Q7J73_08780 [Dehalococcoidales bacterium]|nr:hypothetical protein [Dehalococcoidales bacterium]